ncbi:SRPBCC family protein [Streptomyces sp. NPDC005202]|uniref:SRPBCC family protein n=1 Tax=Streptomyces sp. NPDC005202 TaxID=3157021 RepID=UPI0033B0656A
MEWTGARYPDKPTVEAAVWIDAPPQAVWDLVSDIGLMPRISNELQSVEWLDGCSGPRVGARFLGRSRHEALGEWSTTSYVVTYEPPRVFSWAVQDRQNPSAVWRFTLEPQEGGTLLRQWAQLGPGPSGLSLAIEQMPDKEQKIVFVRLREFETAIRATLTTVKEIAESASGATSAATAADAGKASE